MELILPVAIAIIIAHLSMRYYKEVWGAVWIVGRALSPILLYIVCVIAVAVVNGVSQW